MARFGRSLLDDVVACSKPTVDFGAALPEADSGVETSNAEIRGPESFHECFDRIRPGRLGQLQDPFRIGFKHLCLDRGG